MQDTWIGAGQRGVVAGSGGVPAVACGGARVVRVHALVQQVAADHLTGSQQAALAQAAADALEQAEITPARFLIDLNKTATYVFTRGAPFFVFSHFTFLVDYVKAWRKEQGDQAVADALADPEATVSGRSFMTKLVRWQRIPLGIKPWIMLAALTLNLVLLPLWLFLSVLKSAWLILEKGVRSVPPLITAVVVVFVTSDAWRILRHRVHPAVYPPGGCVYAGQSALPDPVQGLLGGGQQGI
jgi:hypothetical protein